MKRNKIGKSLYVISRLLWEEAIFSSKLGIILCGLAFLTDLTKDCIDNSNNNVSKK